MRTACRARLQPSEAHIHKTPKTGSLTHVSGPRNGTFNLVGGGWGGCWDTIFGGSFSSGLSLSIHYYVMVMNTFPVVAVMAEGGVGSGDSFNLGNLPESLSRWHMQEKESSISPSRVLRLL